jgi:hypothetical protein
VRQSERPTTEDKNLKTVTAEGQRADRPRRRSGYYQKVDAALKAIAALNPVRGDSISETAILVPLMDDIDRAMVREAVQDAFQLLVDMGIASPIFVQGLRIRQLYDFHESFGPTDVPDVLGWNGRDERLTTENEHNGA